MTAPERTNDPCEQAALYVLGALDGPAAAAYEAHAESCSGCQTGLTDLRRVAAELAFAAEPAPPPPAVKARLMAQVHGSSSGGGGSAISQVWKQWGASPGDPVVFVEGDGADWQEVGIAGVRVRPLFVDPVEQMVTMLVQMDPGVAYPAHRHSRGEECYVISGDLRIGERTMHAGDYQRAAAGSDHPLQSTEAGCLLLIRSSQEDELLPSR